MANQYTANRNMMKQTSNKNIGTKVDVLKWSEDMDLLAIGTEKGEVLLQRLKWQKVWQLPPPEEGLKVREIAWRPWEKLIAIGYNNGTILLINIETKEEVYRFSVDADISCMSWTENTEELPSDDISYRSVTAHAKYLPELPLLSSISSSAKPINYNRNNFCSKHILNILIVGTTMGRIHLMAFGMLPCGNVDVLAMLGIPSRSTACIRDAKMSLDFKQLIVALEFEDALNLVVLENAVLFKYSASVLCLALKHAQMLNTMAYMDDTIECIIEAWETVLLEMDNKLTSFSKEQPEGSISADFLELLMFATSSPALEQFLLRDLTEKGLRKLGTSIELCYVTMQKLVVKPLYTAIYDVFYHLTTLDGMLRNRYHYGVLLSTPATELLRNCGSLQIKAYELQKMIDMSKRDFKIFFRWLHVVIVRLMDESPQENQPTITQQEVNYLGDFLNNFDSSASQPAPEHERSAIESRRKFNLERVGQYLVDKPLVMPPAAGQEEGESQWKHLLSQNQCLRECPAIFTHHENFSLVQQHKLLKQSFKKMFDQPSAVISADFRHKNSLTIRTDSVSGSNRDSTSVARSITFINHPQDEVTLVAVVQSEDSLLFAECYPDAGLKIVRIRFEEKPYFDQRFDAIGRLTFRQAQFYSVDTLSLLLRAYDEANTTTGCYFLLLNLRPIREFLNRIEPREFMQTLTEEAIGCHGINAYTLIDESSLKLLDSNDGHMIAVSGKRNVMAVVSESLKNVRVYDMDGADEEDDMLDTSSQINSSLENSQESIPA
ncbi:anaphase-promoting complex subunit 4 [Anopheles ziemanni]|uniref:anaphase-promoting complex subunit 4 n=1 Tax=Anopheles coustani TaxID=139045 RepID=UPI002659468B|nr:anaphase-promoting complex subunit 4 [Anopheles coustani]XP_058174186.1 anaphase-promoting complex subunit 4 [Anopheles ziemanni]